MKQIWAAFWTALGDLSNVQLLVSLLPAPALGIATAYLETQDKKWLVGALTALCWVIVFVLLVALRGWIKVRAEGASATGAPAPAMTTAPAESGGPTRRERIGIRAPGGEVDLHGRSTIANQDVGVDAAGGRVGLHDDSKIQ